MNLKPRENASARTKNRLREHNIDDLVSDGRDNGRVIDGVVHGFFRCSDHCDWVGWLPLNEVGT